MTHSDFLSVDPGVHYFAYACIRERQLVACGLSHEKRELHKRFPFDFVLVETQRVHAGKEKLKGDIVDLAHSAGEILGQFPTGMYWPLTQLKKDVFQARAVACLTPAEIQVLEGHKKSDQKHIKDAIGFAMRYLGRM